MLFQYLQRPDAFYDPFTVGWLIKSLITEPNAFEEQYPNFRTLTYKISATLLMTLAFNKSWQPRCLLENESELLIEASNLSIQNMIHLVLNKNLAAAYNFL